MPTDRSTIFCELGCLGAVIDAHPRGHPSCVYLLIYYGLATLSTENETIYSRHNIQWWPQLRMRGIDLVPKTRYSGGQIKWHHLLMTTCCGGLKSPEPHSGVPWPTIPHSGVIVVIQCRGQLIWGQIVCATPCQGVYDQHKGTYEAVGQNRRFYQ